MSARSRAAALLALAFLAACANQAPPPKAPEPEVGAFLAFGEQALGSCPKPATYPPGFAQKLGAEAAKLKRQGGYGEVLRALADYRSERQKLGAP